MATLITSGVIGARKAESCSEETASVRSSLGEVGFFLRYLRPYWRLVIGVVVLTLTANLLRLPLLYLPASPDGALPILRGGCWNRRVGPGRPVGNRSNTQRPVVPPAIWWRPW